MVEEKVSFKILQVQILDARRALAEFLEKDEADWLSMWGQLSIGERRCLVRTVIPHLPISLENTNCVCGCGNLASEAALCPEINLEGLVEGPTAPPTCWPSCTDLQKIPHLPQMTVSGNIHKVMMWHVFPPGDCSLTQWWQDKRDTFFIRRQQSKGLLTSPRTRQPWLQPLFYIGLQGPIYTRAC
jgi:hypothetical protein